MRRHNGQSGKIIPFVVRVLARPRRLRFVVVVLVVVLQKISRETLAVVVVAGNNNNELRNAVVSLLSSGYRIGNSRSMLSIVE